jgi:ApbE superfamily uncharacterized protein (UPF0280 family)
MLYLEQGPSSLVISARRLRDNREPNGARVLEVLSKLQREIKDALPILRLKAARVVNPRHLPWIARKMVEAACAVAPEELTAMSAVAGAVSDGIKAFLLDEGFELALVNNGGDIAGYSALDETISIGTARRPGGPKGPVLKIKGPFEVGIATSGLGGRSLTKGIADFVTVIARDASVADAAATFLCNATGISSPRITRVLAEALDPETDIAGEWVTLERGELERPELEEALHEGLSAARDLKNKDIIMDAVLDVGGLLASTIGPGSRIRLEESYGD